MLWHAAVPFVARRLDLGRWHARLCTLAVRCRRRESAGTSARAGPEEQTVMLRDCYAVRLEGADAAKLL